MQRRDDLSPYWAARYELQMWRRRSARLKALGRGSLIIILVLSLGLAILPVADFGGLHKQVNKQRGAPSAAPLAFRPSFAT